MTKQEYDRAYYQANKEKIIEKNKKWRVDNKERSNELSKLRMRLRPPPPSDRKVKGMSMKEYHRFNNYGISPEDYNQRYEMQDGLCMICGEKDIEVVEHDHESGKVRGLACTTCNTMLGMAYDNPDILRAGADYLKDYG
ncbi:MAG: hypothetical protein HOG25_15110 [Gammaproteobacteria bacterium]|nr:hypothetical protein [Gammaproteobacteria bacterium]